MESSMESLLVVFSSIFVLLLVPLFLLFRSRSRPIPLKNDAVVEEPSVPHHVGTRRMRRRNLDMASTSGSTSLAEEAHEEEEMEEQEFQHGYYSSKSSKKKEIKKQEKAARRQVEDASRDLQKQKQDRYAEMRRRKDEEREAEELRKEEEARLQRIKEEEAANAEFEKWKDAFTVDTEGNMEEEMKEESGGLLHDFIEYIKVDYSVMDEILRKFLLWNGQLQILDWHTIGTFRHAL